MTYLLTIDPSVRAALGMIGVAVIVFLALASFEHADQSDPDDIGGPDCSHDNTD